MDLWIRTQSKRSLIKVKDIAVERKTENVIFITSNEWRLGTYKSYERAMQILDEIQYILQPRVIYHEPKINYDDMIHLLSENIMIKGKQEVEMELKQAGQIVYQMPEE